MANLSSISSDGSHIKTHFQLEDDTVKQLLVLEKEFRTHHNLTLCEIISQRETIDRLCILTQRFILLISTGPCCKYPDVYSAPAEDAILQEYYEKLKLLRSSNQHINQSLDSLRQHILVFEELTAQLDFSVESPFILGDVFHKPISFFIELVCDLFKYMHAQMLKLKYHAHQMDPLDLQCIEDYRKVLETSEEFDEYLNLGLTYCKCLKPKQVCPEITDPCKKIEPLSTAEFL